VPMSGLLEDVLRLVRDGGVFYSHHLFSSDVFSNEALVTRLAQMQVKAAVTPDICASRC